jgi:hypothetical protein
MTFDRNEFEFDDFDDDNNFSFGDDEGDFNTGDEGDPASFGGDSGYGFGEEEMGGIDDDFDFSSPEDMPEDTDFGDDSEGGGFNRNFIILAAVMIGLFVVGLILVVFLALRPTQPTDLQLTATVRVAANNTVAAQLAETQTAQPTINAQMTQTAQVTPPSPRPPTFTPTPTVSPMPTLDSTQAAANVLLTQTVIGLTETAQFLLTPPTMQPPDANAVALTATALVETLRPPQGTPDQGGGFATPLPEQITPSGGALATPAGLPDTGLFDDLGGASVGLIALLGLGLVGVIMVSRRVRSSVSK